MPLWFAFALMTLTLWGLAGVTQKLSSNYISPELSTIWFSAAFVPIAIVVVATNTLDWKAPAGALLLGIVGGTLNGLGVLTCFAAFRSGGKATIVTPLTALYPVVTVALAVPIFRERINARELTAIVIAIAATAALSYESEAKPDSGDARLRTGDAPTDDLSAP